MENIVFSIFDTPNECMCIGMQYLSVFGGLEACSMFEWILWIVWSQNFTRGTLDEIDNKSRKKSDRDQVIFSVQPIQFGTETKAIVLYDWSNMPFRNPSRNLARLQPRDFDFELWASNESKLTTERIRTFFAVNRPSIWSKNSEISRTKYIDQVRKFRHAVWHRHSIQFASSDAELPGFNS